MTSKKRPEKPEKPEHKLGPFSHQQFCIKFKELRRERKKTFREIAIFTGERLSYFSKLEYGTNSAPSLRIAKKLDELFETGDLFYNLSAQEHKIRLLEIKQKEKESPILKGIVTKLVDLDNEQLEGIDKYLETLKEQN